MYATLEGEYNERLKIFTDESLKDERVGYAIVTPKTTIKNRMKSQTTIISAEQEAIIKAIFISKGKGATVIATHSLSTIMAVEGTRWTKNPKTRRIRELLDQENERVKLMWIPTHSGITRNERPDEAAKNALEEVISDRELYPPHRRKKQTRKVDTGRKHHEIQKGNYRVEGRFNQPMQKGASGGIQTKDGVHTSNT
jgi:ribonuclease HI